MTKLKTKFSSPLLSAVLKGSLISVSVSLVLILIFALLIKFLNIPDKFIQPVNQAIKIISIFVGCYFALKNSPKKGFVTGALIGVIYTILAYLIFSLLGNTFTITVTIFVDILFSLIIGSICGVFLVNKKIKL